MVKQKTNFHIIVLLPLPSLRREKINVDSSEAFVIFKFKNTYKNTFSSHYDAYKVHERYVHFRPDFLLLFIKLITVSRVEIALSFMNDIQEMGKD